MTREEQYYQTAYQHGQEAFARGESKSQVSSHYWKSAIHGDLGVRGWLNGWTDAYRATLTDLWWDDASYAAYQAMG